MTSLFDGPAKAAAGQVGEKPAAPSPLATALAACRRGFKLVLGFSVCINVLMLTVPLYMLQIFDRVLAGGSIDTLIFLTLIAVIALLAYAALEAVRGRVMIELGTWLENRLTDPVLETTINRAARERGPESVQGLRDVQTLRGFLTGPSAFPIIDAPWTPLFIGVIFMLHIYLGWMALAGAAVLLGLAMINDRTSRTRIQRSGAAANAALRQAETAVRNADTVVAMGLAGNLCARLKRANAEALNLLGEASRSGGDMAAISRFCRMVLQLSMLAVGAWLVLGGELTAGGMIAGSILLGRALAPVDQAIGSWRSAVGAMAAFERIDALLGDSGSAVEPMPLPVPDGDLEVKHLGYIHADASEPVLRNVNFRIKPGESLGIIGPTATGKTTLARLLTGVIEPQSGTVRLDGADISRWSRDDVGRHIGYLPQDVELFAGTVKDNIARMGEADPDEVVAAAKLADLHEMILRLPDGYDTLIGEGGVRLSGGQGQRVALARALFGNPRFMVLDEPNANLDYTGDSALINAMDKLRQHGVTTVIIAHRPSVLRHVDKILVLREDNPPQFGDRDDILPKFTRPVMANSDENNEGKDHDVAETA